MHTRTLLKVKILKDLTEISPYAFHLICMYNQHKKLKSILFCATYRPPDCSVMCLVNYLMENYLQALTYGKDVFVARDFNCDVLKSTQESNAFPDLCLSLNLTQLMTAPTRVTPQSPSLIDVILTSNTAIVAESGVVENHISDHYLIHIVLELKLPKPPSTYIIAKSFKNYDPDRFVADLTQVPWWNNSLIHDVNEQLDQFNRNFLEILDSHTPFRS